MKEPMFFPPTPSRTRPGYRPLSFAAVACAGLIATHAGSGVAQAQPVLNEIMADNRSAVGNGGEFPDYIELHNPTAQAISLAGMSLTDDPTKPRQFVFPGGVNLPARGYLVIWCDSSTGSPGMHTGFGLGAKGDRVLLYAANGTTVLDEVSFGLQVPNLPIARIPDGSGSWGLAQATARSANGIQSLGAPADLHINEWMARPLTGEDWIEVFNGSSLPVALGGMILTDNPGLTFSNRPIPPLSFIPARGHQQFFASDLARPDADHLDFKLGASGETLTLYASDRVTQLDRIQFGAQADDLSQGRAPDGGGTIVTFPAGQATPGKPNFVALTDVVISEVLTHTDPPLEDAIELQNISTAPIDISHWWLSDTVAQPRKYRIPANTVLPAGGFKVFYQYQFGAGADGFSLNSSQGDDVYLSAGDANGELTGGQTFVEVGAAKNSVSFGRHVTSVGVDFVPSRSRSFGVDTPSTLNQFRLGTGLTNVGPRIGPLVMTEIMFHPGDALTDEYIELHNPGTTSVALYHPIYPTNRWRIRGGVSFDFPANHTVPGGGYVLLVNFSPSAEPNTLASFRSRFAVPAGVPVLGPYAGTLSDAGGSIQVQWPDETQGPDKPDAGFTPYELVERIQYSSVAPWPTGAGGSGYSLQRHGVSGYGNEPLNWHTAAPTAGRASSPYSGRDSDQDGMPDEWELANGLDPESGTDAGEDGDGDTASNVSEYQAGTDPRSANSVLRVRQIAPEPGGVRITFWGVAGKSYQIQFRPGLSEGSWQTVTSVPGVLATGEVDASVPLSPGPAGFLRVKLE